MKIAAFGSCLSNITIARMQRFGFEQLLSVHHNRSDAFLKYFVDRSSPQIPYDALMAKFVFKPELEEETRKYIRNQYVEGLGYHDLMARKAANGLDFFREIKEEKFDVILMDNFMDLASKMAVWKDHPVYGDSPVFFNFGSFENETELLSEFDYTYDYLSGQQSAINNMRIYKWLRRMQPDAKIYFMCYHGCSSTDNPRRQKAARDFYIKLSQLATFEDLILIPPLDVAENWQKGTEDWPHFQDPVYDALAGYLFLHICAGYGRPFKPFKLPK